MVFEFLREWISDNYNYIPSFTRIWEAARKEIKVKDVKKIKSSSQALMLLRKEKARLDFDMQREPTIKYVVAPPEFKKRRDRLEIITRYIKTLSNDRFPKTKFSEFLGKKRETLVYVSYVNKRGKKIEYVRENNPWSDDEVTEVRRLYKLPVEILFKKKGNETEVHYLDRISKATKKDKLEKIASTFSQVTEDKNWLPRTADSISSKIRKLKKKGGLND